MLVFMLDAPTLTFILLVPFTRTKDTRQSFLRSSYPANELKAYCSLAMLIPGSDGTQLDCESRDRHGGCRSRYAMPTIEGKLQSVN